MLEGWGGRTSSAVTPHILRRNSEASAGEVGRSTTFFSLKRGGVAFFGGGATEKGEGEGRGHREMKLQGERKILEESGGHGEDASVRVEGRRGMLRTCS